MSEALSVLIIEDDPDVALGCEQALQLDGITAQCVSSAEQARGRLGRDFRGIVVSDIRLPKMDGMAFLREMLALDPELMLLDEPTQGMGHEDVDRVMQLIKKVSANRTILMVEHNMKVVAGISDTLTVLARGSVLAEGPYAEVAANPLVIEAYMGTEVTELTSPVGH